MVELKFGVAPVSRYVAIVDGEPGTFGVVVPDLPGCTSGGATIETALKNAVEAVRLWVEDAEADGEPIPEPRPVETLRHDPSIADDIARGAVLAFVPLLRESGRSTRVNLSLDVGVLDAIDAEAKRRGLTRSAFLASAARDAIVRGI